MLTPLVFSAHRAGWRAHRACTAACSASKRDRNMCNAVRSAASPDLLFQNLNRVHDSPGTPALKPTGRGRDESWHARDAEDGWQPGKQSRSRRPKIRRSHGPSNGAEGPVSSARNSTSPSNARLCILRGTCSVRRHRPLSAEDLFAARRRAVWCGVC